MGQCLHRKRWTLRLSSGFSDRPQTLEFERFHYSGLVTSGMAVNEEFAIF
jgi:hypothetical protein